MSAPAVFVTGATGFIGCHVVREFAAAGHPVLALVHHRESPQLTELVDAGKAAVIRGDAVNPQVIDTVGDACAARGWELGCVVHAAGRATDVGRRLAFQRANVDTVRNVAKLVTADDSVRLIHISTTDVYGLRDFHGEAEDELPCDDNRGNPYAASKIEAEEWLRDNVPPEQCVVLRPAAVWGPDDTTLTLRFADFLRWSPVVVHFGKWRGRNRWPLAHVRNVAMAALAASHTQATGQAINVVDNERTTIDEFYDLVARAYHPCMAHHRLCLPLALGTGLGAVSSGIAHLLGRDRPLFDPSHYAVHSTSWNLDFSNARFNQLLQEQGMTPVSRTEGEGGLR